jgi:2-amino-4-hydroxy-6-hydroxymethyldihydropteridine diphosphokinase
MNPRLVVIALGSNLGDSRQTVTAAMDRVGALSGGAMRRSSLWQTAPIDCPPGSPAFLNAVVVFEPKQGETPETLLHKLKSLEREFGRRPKTILNEPRPLDLDLIAFGNEIRSTSELTLPHPRAHERRFVLEPLNEIAPDYVLPAQTKTVAELLAQLPSDPGVSKSPQSTGHPSGESSNR